MESTTVPLTCTFGVDCGASFSKLVYFQPTGTPPLPSYVIQELLPEIKNILPDPSLNLSNKNGKVVLNFIKIPNKRFADFIEYLKNSKIVIKFGIQEVSMTGGGAYKYSNMIQEKLGVPVNELNEFEMLAKGLNYVLEHNDKEIFSVPPDTKHHAEVVKIPVCITDGIFPCMMVNMGSGVSILELFSDTYFERISGSHLGGGSFLSLCEYLTGISSWKEIMEASKIGNSEHVDILVGDIYGFDDSKYEQLGLNAAVIASSFGKLQTPFSEKESNYTKEDIIKSLLHMVANNIGQIAFLNAKLKGIKNIFFTGGFVSENSYLWTRLSFAIHFWSKGTMKALFVEHNTYLGSIGSLVSQSQSNQNKGVL